MEVNGQQLRFSSRARLPPTASSFHFWNLTFSGAARHTEPGVTARKALQTGRARCVALSSQVSLLPVSTLGTRSCTQGGSESELGAGVLACGLESWFTEHRTGHMR